MLWSDSLALLSTECEISSTVRLTFLDELDNLASEGLTKKLIYDIQTPIKVSSSAGKDEDKLLIVWFATIPEV